MRRATTMDVREMARRGGLAGGKSRSPRKVAAARANLKKALRALARKRATKRGRS